MLILDVLLLAVLLITPPSLLAQHFCKNPWNRACTQAVLLASAATAIALLLHYLHIPIRRNTLILAHAIYGGLAIALFSIVTLFAPRSDYDYGRRLRMTILRRPLGYGGHGRGVPSPVIVARNRPPTSLPKAPSFFSFRARFKDAGLLYLLPIALFLFPYTRFTGIDTYKWQDLATAIRMDETIPWLIHPVGLFGFLPRSYPSLQPTLLATIQIMGNLGVEGGFRVLSLLTLWVGFSTSRCWFSRFLNSKDATLCALAYVLMPVFVRYTHWATGRGLFLAIIPALLCLLTRTEDETKSPQTLRTMVQRWLGIVLLGLLLVLSHKAAWIALPLLLVSHICRRCIPARWYYRAMLLAPMLVFGVLISQSMLIPGLPGKGIGAAYIMLTRFAWMLPLAALAWLLDQKNPLTRQMPLARFAFAPSLLLAFDPQMYGALIALPFIVAFAVPPTLQFTRYKPSRYRQATVIALALLLILSASAVVIHRSAYAATADVKDAALFLNQHDPVGPFQIHAPNHARTRIQAYVDGCPRFVLSGNPKLVMRLPPLPQTVAHPSRKAVFAWTGWLRNLVTIQGLQVQWYGDIQANYYFQINGLGTIPKHARLIYQNNTVHLYQE